MKVAILYYNFLDRRGVERSIGGVQTYIWHLSRLLIERGDEPIVVQLADEAFERQVDHLKIIGVPSDRRRFWRNDRKKLYERGLSLVASTGGLIIFGAHLVSVPTRYPRAISIQHGISWDLPGRFLRPRLGRTLGVPIGVSKRYSAYRHRLLFDNCPNRVCVDYNYLNWYRTQIPDVPKGRIWVIPNCVDVRADYRPNLSRHEKGPVRILFARRFTEQRGCRLMIEATRRLLDRFQDVEVCFAGEGPDERLIEETFRDDERVTIDKYLPHESLRIHESAHIAVVPSLGSEGTSLSLAEAMAAGCAVVATNVGGLTNMVINGYNGLFVNPDVKDLEGALAGLIRDPEARIKLGWRAAETAREAFSRERWAQEWSKVLDEIQKTPMDAV